jgi:dethiobiotin synthetase
VNIVTPRIFIAATHQDDGKTTSSLGLFAALGKRFGRIGYIKPVGQRFREVEGMLIDEDSVLIEGTGHAGVGSVFDLSNARVAQLLCSKVLIVTRGGIGRPIDDIALNKALFDQQGVEVVGVILNKVISEKCDYIAGFARRGLGRLGIDLLGVVPMAPILAKPTLQQVCERIQVCFRGEELWQTAR